MVVSHEVGVYQTSEDREVLLCPWHGYEFDVDTGRCPADPMRMRASSYDVFVEGGKVFLESERRRKP